MSLRWRLALWYLALLSLSLMLFSVALFLTLERSLLKQIDRDLQSQAGTIHDSAEFEHGEYVLEFQHAQPGYLLFYFDARGRLIRSSHPALAGVADPRASGLDLVTLEGSRWRRFTKGLDHQGQPAGKLQILRSLEPVETSLEQLKLIFGFAIPATLALSALGGLSLAGRALRPLSEVTRAAGELGANDLSRRLSQPAGDGELARLVTTFNAMLARLEEAFARERQFTSNAAHELRTPVSLIAARAQLTLSKRRGPEQYEDALREIAAESGHLTRLLSKLLKLARAEKGDDVLQLETLDACGLARDVLSSLQPEACSRGVLLKLEGPEQVLIRADQTRLSELLLNLVENAIQFSPFNGTVSLTLEPVDGWLQLLVQDQGAGIPTQLLERIFERFYQVDAARSRDGRQSSGLGLAICRSIAELHGGRLTAENLESGGACLRLLLPLTD